MNKRRKRRQQRRSGTRKAASAPATPPAPASPEEKELAPVPALPRVPLATQQVYAWIQERLTWSDYPLSTWPKRTASAPPDDESAPPETLAEVAPPLVPASVALARRAAADECFLEVMLQADSWQRQRHAIRHRLAVEFGIQLTARLDVSARTLGSHFITRIASQDLDSPQRHAAWTLLNAAPCLTPLTPRFYRAILWPEGHNRLGRGIHPLGRLLALATQLHSELAIAVLDELFPRPVVHRVRCMSRELSRVLAHEGIPLLAPVPDGAPIVIPVLMQTVSDHEERVRHRHAARRKKANSLRRMATRFLTCMPVVPECFMCLCVGGDERPLVPLACGHAATCAACLKAAGSVCALCGCKVAVAAAATQTAADPASSTPPPAKSRRRRRGRRGGHRRARRNTPHENRSTQSSPTRSAKSSCSSSPAGAPDRKRPCLQDSWRICAKELWAEPSKAQGGKCHATDALSWRAA